MWPRLRRRFCKISAMLTTSLEESANAANSLEGPAVGLPDADVATRRPPTGAPINSEATQLGYWSELEVEGLKSAVESLQNPGRLELVDWQKVSELVPSRSAKQCRQVHKGKARMHPRSTQYGDTHFNSISRFHIRRQKWLNHCLPGISKDPWSLQEE